MIDIGHIFELDWTENVNGVRKCPGYNIVLDN